MAFKNVLNFELLILFKGTKTIRVTSQMYTSVKYLIHFSTSQFNRKNKCS